MLCPETSSLWRSRRLAGRVWLKGIRCGKDVRAGSQGWQLWQGMAISAAAVASPRNPTEPVKITSFSGAYLAARIAEGDNDLDNAIAYYKQALAFDARRHLAAAEPDAVADRARPLRGIPCLCRQAQGSSRCRALLAAGAGRRFLPQEGFHQGAILAQAVARIRSRPADLPASCPAGPRKAPAMPPTRWRHRQAAGAGLVRPVQVLPSRADRRCLGPVGQGRCALCRDPDRHHRRRCCSRDMDAQRPGLCVLPGPQGRQEQGALRARQGRGVRAGQAGHHQALRDRISKGDKIEPLRRQPVGRRLRDPA